MKKIVFILLILVFSSAPFSYALNTDTHKALNEYVSRSKLNGFSLDVYLKDQLKIPGGIEEDFKTEGATLKAWQWLRDGGEYEDAPPELPVPYQRSANHFNNPLGSPKGLSGSALTTYFNYFLRNGYNEQFFSSSEWMMRTQNTQSIGGYYSWYDVKDYYLKALTSPSADDRNKYFALTFRGLGQLMHLVQDASVPSHTRNDVHIRYNYENYVESFVKKNGVPTPGNSDFFNGKYVAIASLIDTNKYKGNNPYITTRSGIGLSEYTNANFFSEHTITSSSLPYPSIAENARPVTRDIVVKSLLGLSTTTHPRQYYMKTANSMNEWNGESKNGNGYLLSTVDFLKDYRVKYLTYNQYQPIAPILDDNVYADNASLLLPRAVGYSSQVLQYFFRGQIDMVKDPDNVGKYLIENKSNEAMSGTFSLYYDDINGNRNKITSWELSINANGKTVDPVTFSEPTDPAPKESGKYILVFNGKLGNEPDAVVGKAVDQGGIWEGWDGGIVNEIDRYGYSWHITDLKNENSTYFKFVNRMSYLATNKHSWNGYSGTAESPDPNSRVEDGVLKIDAFTGDFPIPGFSDYYTSFSNGFFRTDTSSKPIPVLGCKFKVSIPAAGLGYHRNGYWGRTQALILLRIRNKVNDSGYNNFNIAYAIEPVSTLNSAQQELGYIMIPSGVVERSLEDDYRHVENAIWWYKNWGNIKDWYITDVAIYYGVQGKNNFMKLAVDYVDFVCK